PFFKMQVVERYIDLLKKSVGNFIYNDDVDLMRNGRPCDKVQRYNGGVWPSKAQTMIGMMRLNNLQWCMESLIANDIPGAVIEAGVWRGGAAIFMRGILAAHGVKDKRVFVADSFCGLPKPNIEKYPLESDLPFWKMDALAVSRDEVERNFAS